MAGHLTLLPGYVSAGHYALHSEKRVPAAWLVMNLLASAASGSLGAVLVVAGVDAALDDDNDRRQAGTVAAFGGGTLVAGATVVAVASITQRGRPESPAPLGGLSLRPRLGRELALLELSGAY